jgi:hypothetical protein
MFVIGFVQGINYMKFFALCLRNITIARGLFSLIICLFFATFDIVLEGFFRNIWNFRETNFSGGRVWLRVSVIVTLYWCFTHSHQLIPSLAPAPIIPTAVVFAVVSGATSAIAVWMASKSPFPAPTEKKRSKRVKPKSN